MTVTDCPARGTAGACATRPITGPWLSAAVLLRAPGVPRFSGTGIAAVYTKLLAGLNAAATERT